MRPIINIAVIMIALAVSFSVSAEILQCDSENVTIKGPIKTKYLRMGHSVFSGSLNVQIYDQQKIVSTSTLTIFNGDIQDDVSYSSESARDQSGQPVRFSIVHDGASFIQIGDSSLQFTPHCQITPDTSPPIACPSDPSLGQRCHLYQGKCICYQHNGH